MKILTKESIASVSELDNLRIIGSNIYEVESMARKYARKVDWDHLCTNYDLSDTFLDEFSGRINRRVLIENRKLTDTYLNVIPIPYWDDVCKYQSLSLELIEKRTTGSDWDVVAKYQDLPANFIKKFKDKLKWQYISENKKISQSIKEECYPEMFAGKSAGMGSVDF